jgi:hypothetical protein
MEENIQNSRRRANKITRKLGGDTKANLTTWDFVLFERIADWSLHAAGETRILEDMAFIGTVHQTLFNLWLSLSSLDHLSERLHITTERDEHSQVNQHQTVYQRGSPLVGTDGGAS